MTLGGILEFVLGNTFAFVVFCSYGKCFADRSYNQDLEFKGLMSLQADSGSRWAVRSPHLSTHTVPTPRILRRPTKA